MLKIGRKSTEWWGVVSVGGIVFLKMIGILPEDATVESIQTETIPLIIDKVTALADKHGELLVYVGVVWAYLKRRTHLKSREISSREGNKI